jgi:hypothetical protein
MEYNTVILFFYILIAVFLFTKQYFYTVTEIWRIYLGITVLNAALQFVHCGLRIN